MAKLSDHHADKFVKILNVGDSGAGKTGSLTSLVAAGYKLRILDLDNGLDVLRAFILRECSNKIDNVDYETRRDLYKAGPLGPTIQGVPKAYTQSLGLLTEWSDKTKPSEWGPEYIFVIDSLTGLGHAAYEWAKAMAPAVKDPRQWYHTAQQALESVLALATSEAFRTNLIIMAHIQYQESHDGTTRGYANSIGKALGPMIPTYFNTMVLTKSEGFGKNVKRTINTVPTSMLDLKNPAPFRVDASFPLETGFATLFKQLKEPSNVA